MVRVAFIHPDLGIGGAERLVVDAAQALQSRGHKVDMYTAHHNPDHCFAETKDGTLNVSCVGDWLPRHFCHKGYALFAYLRMIYAAFYLVFFSWRHYDVIVCDQISACIPVLRFSSAKIIFYCHFPDQLLTQRRTLLKRLYRLPIDSLEEYTTGLADIVLVNSKFTSSIFHKTFKSLRSIKPSVLYPSLNFSSFDRPPIDLAGVIPSDSDTVFLSINRFERKKNLSLAVKAFACLLKTYCKDATPHLIIAGGYDERVVENKEYYSELVKLASDLDIRDKVTFLRSFSDDEKVALLHHCTALIYTPANEHFGICPLEAMYMKKPVVAVKSGGPLETVLEGKTGFLCEPVPEEFAKGMHHFLQDCTTSAKMGENSRDHVVKNFSFSAFTEQLNTVVTQVLSSGGRTQRQNSFLCVGVTLGCIMCAVLSLVVWYLC